MLIDYARKAGDDVYNRFISNAIQPSHPLMPSSLSALNLIQHQEPPGPGQIWTVDFSLSLPHHRRKFRDHLSMGSLSRTWLSDFTFTFPFHALKKAMATHSSVLAWRIPGTGEPGGLPSMGSHRVRHDWRDLAAAAAPQEYDFCLPSTQKFT